MADLSVAFNAPIVVSVNGEEVSFPRFSVPELAHECSRLKSVNIAKQRRLIAEFGITGMEAFKLLSAIEDQEPAIANVWADTCYPQAALDILTKSLKKNGKNEEQAKEILNKMLPDTVIETALAVTGYKAVAPQEAEEESKKKTKKAADKTVKQLEEAEGFAR